jgi:hypothetical protein
MTPTDPPIDPDAPSALPRRWSPLAAISLMLSVLPIGSLVAPLMGAAALWQLRSRPDLRGRGLAWAGIGIGMLASGLMVGGAWVLAQSFQQLANRPAEAIRDAWAGDADAFRTHLTRPGSEATAARIGAWVSDVSSAVGTPLEVTIDRNPPRAADRPPLPEREMLAAYRARVKAPDGTERWVPLEVVFERPMATEAIGAIRIRRLAFVQADGTRIVFPDDGVPAEPTPSVQPAD